jgi:hypothetical protein
MEAKNEPRSLRIEAIFVNAAERRLGRARLGPAALQFAPKPADLSPPAKLPAAVSSPG